MLSFELIIALFIFFKIGREEIIIFMYLQATPTLLRRFGSQLIKSTVLSASTSLRVLALGGEAFPSLTVLKGWREVGNRTQIFNVYGITEVSSWATFYRIPEEILNSTLK